ncbi:MmyB family transcriptional regulator [Arthrobacter sp. SF27]|uniref:MmyB family transcriptional regulator n=1 Tax=Crystallibacter degradans TaxID=2726743 RepID=UPI00197C16B7
MGGVGTHTRPSLRLTSGRYPTDARLAQLIGELTMKSDEFASLWAEGDVVDSAVALAGAGVDIPQLKALPLDYFGDTPLVGPLNNRAAFSTKPNRGRWR